MPAYFPPAVADALVAGREPPVLATAFFADLHIHSRFSLATSRDLDLVAIARGAIEKGITVVATGDFCHPRWKAELEAMLVPAEPGLFRLRPELEQIATAPLPLQNRHPVRFMLSTEISTVYRASGRTRRVHHLVYAPDFAAVSHLSERLGAIGSLSSDGRPILRLDSRDLLELVLESSPDAHLVPAHIWTPWYSVLGARSGFDSIEECYRDLAHHVFALETGLSSDPAMNRRCSFLDRFALISSSDAHATRSIGREATVLDCPLEYFAIFQALRDRQGLGGTIEFFPEEGKYHSDGHRSCGIRFERDETLRAGGRCPVCTKPLTIGVAHRIEQLADRDKTVLEPFICLVSLAELLAETMGVGPRSRRVATARAELLGRFGPELDILCRVPLADLGQAPGDERFARALERLRNADVTIERGYDGRFGAVHLGA